jgi:DNA-binding PadR family transcriptional regulator
MTERRSINATAASLLGFRHDSPMTGYELAATAQRVIGDFWSLTQSQVYRELAWMAEAGFVTPGERGTRDRRPYALAEPGRSAFAEWVVRPPGAETIRHPLLLTTSFGRHVPPDRLAAFIRRHREAHAERLHVTRPTRRGRRAAVKPTVIRSRRPRSPSVSPTSVPSWNGSTVCPKRSRPRPTSRITAADA